MEEKDFKKLIIPVLIGLLAIISFFIIKPVGTAVILGLLFSYIFSKVYKKINRRIKSETSSALIVVGGMVIIILVPILILTPIFIKQLFNVYIGMRNADVSAIIFKIFPGLTSSQQIATEVAATASHFNANISELVLSIVKDTILNTPALIFGVIVLLFVFYFGLKESQSMHSYLSTILPLSKEHEEKFYDKFYQVTDSVLYGQLIVGIAQGLISGIGYFMFGIPNALLLTVITILVGIIPIIGPWLVWIPLDIFLFINGNTVAGMQLLIYGLFVINWVDTLLRPAVIARRAEMSPAIALIGAVGGIYAFGIIGFILGPLVLAYLILFIEIYKGKNTESMVLKEKESFSEPQK